MLPLPVCETAWIFSVLATLFSILATLELVNLPILLGLGIQTFLWGFQRNYVGSRAQGCKRAWPYPGFGVQGVGL